jgi:U3 small nucleolar RNA-associated protein 11
MLDVARERLKALTQAEEALDLQRAKMAKSPTVRGVNKHGVKFKVRERKR